MLEKTYSYMGYKILQYVYNYGGETRRYFYPECNGNVESTNIRDICKYIKTLVWIAKINKKYLAPTWKEALALQFPK